MEKSNKKANRLIHASSPYLLQHAYNPVDWYEWGEEAFAKARKEDKLVLVSIGYSACHWCHVMERECFEKEDTAALMNKHFVCIKVDREERPDVDQLYMDAVTLLTGRGGWPLNCFTLPDGRPLHGGTYFPKAEWERVLKSLADFYENKREEAMQYATDLTHGIKKLDILPETVEQKLMSKQELKQLLNDWSKNFDTEFGGYNWAPKFPIPTNQSLFLHAWYHNGDNMLFNGVHTTLTKMAEGGICDQVGGGFARYSTDVYWKVPHFEKMLYDNAQLMGLYAKAYAQKPTPLYQNTVAHIHQFIGNELTSPEGLFYSALDADSEGEEGKFYVWKHTELVELLGIDEPIFSLYFSIDVYGNWEHGTNILYKTRTDEQLEALTGKSIEEIELIIQRCKQILLNHRNKRIRPSLDDKVITSWNAMMISGYTEAYKVFGNQEYLDMAERCMSKLLSKMVVNGRLHRIYKNGKTTIPAFAEDYALMIEALLLLGLQTGHQPYFTKAEELMGESVRLFFDEQTGMFRFKAKDGEQLIANKIDLNDDVIPSANSVMAKNLVVMGYLFDNENYIQLARDMLINVQQKMKKFPSGFSNWMELMLLFQYGFNQVVCTGEHAQSNASVFWKKCLPSTVVLFTKNDLVLPLLENKQQKDNLIYVCKNHTCGLPVNSVGSALEQLKNKKAV